MGASVYGVSLPGMVNGVIHPGKVNGVPFSYLDPYWPVPGVTKPWHLYDFTTGTYNDYGSIGGLTLTAQGSGNSFSSGLVLNGSGYASVANNADLCDLGATWSILWEGIWAAAIDTLASAGSNSSGGDQWMLFAITAGTGIDMRTWNPFTINSDVTSSAMIPGTKYQIVITLSGGTGTVYVNGVNVGSGALLTPIATTGPFAIGFSGQYNGYYLTGTCAKCGILKGTAWSSSDVAAIYAAMP